MEEGIREAPSKTRQKLHPSTVRAPCSASSSRKRKSIIWNPRKSFQKLFKSFFWNMLEQGVYFAPSPYETGFISTAHTEEDIDRTVEAVRISLSRLG